MPIYAVNQLNNGVEINPPTAYGAAGSIWTDDGDGDGSFESKLNLIRNSAAASPTILVTGAPFAGDGATSMPHVFLKHPLADHVLNWSVFGTYFGIDARDVFSGNYIDCRRNGAVLPDFAVSSTGVVTCGGLIINTTQSFVFGSRTRFNSPSDGTLLLTKNDPSAGFTKLYMGGVTAAHPSIAVTVGAGLSFEYADGSGLCPVDIRVKPRKVTVGDAASFTPNCDLADIVSMSSTQSTGTLTLNAPVGTPYDGQILWFRIKTLNAQTFAYNSIYRGSTDLGLSTTASAGRWHYFQWVYNEVDTRWDLFRRTFGF